MFRKPTKIIVKLLKKQNNDKQVEFYFQILIHVNDVSLKKNEADNSTEKCSIIIQPTKQKFCQKNPT